MYCLCIKKLSRAECSKNIFIPEKNYTVTDKADGERYILYTHSDNRVYLINNRLNIKYTGYTHNMKDSILDGEYITKDKYGNKLNMFLIFDVYYLKGKNVSKYPLMKDVIKSRINLINEYQEKYNQKSKIIW